jgi:pimeloyl-ACP methyl ester carboxylesterase
MRVLPILFASLMTSLVLTGAFTDAKADPVRNIVLVHGAFADGSGWQAVYQRLVDKGFKVSVVQEPETSLEDDVDATRRVIDMQDGPVVLVGHSYGGEIITEAGTDPKVKALVYVAAYVPEVGESAASLQGRIPAASTAIGDAGGGCLIIDPARFHADFCADLPEKLANFMAQSQVLTSKSALNAPAKAAAWHDKPSYGIVSGHDRTINPDLERWMYKRAGAKTTEIDGSSHVAMISHPKEVASIIEQAANEVGK